MELKPGYKQTEVGVIPEDWDCVSIRSAASNAPNAIVGGPFGSDLTSADYVYRGVPVVRGTNMGPKMIVGPFVFVSASKAAALSANLARPRDVIFTQRGTLGQVSLVPDKPFESYLVSQSQMKVSLDGSRYSHEYVYHYFSSASGQKQILDSSIQTGVPHTNLGICKKYFFPAPTLLEQEAISEILNDIDSCIEAIQRLVDKKKQVKQAAMQELLTGKRRLPGFEGEWVELQLGDIAAIRNTKTIASSMPAETKCVELESIQQRTGRLLVSNHLTGATTKYTFKTGDVLFGRLRAYLRKFWLASFDGVCSTEIWPLIARDDRLSAGFLHLLVQTNEFIDAACISYGTHMPRSDWAVLRKFQVKLPPRPEQDAIATVIADIDAELSDLVERRQKSACLKQGMMQQLLTGKIRLT